MRIHFTLRARARSTGAFLAFELVAAVAVLSSACTGKSLDVGSADAAPASEASLQSRCSEPGGADEVFATSTDSAWRAQLAGRWLLCDGSGDAGMTLPPGFDFTADGQWFALADDHDGTYSRDPARTGGYHTGKTMSCCYPDTWVIGLAGAAFDPPSFYVTFRPDPLQMSWALSSTHGSEPRPTVARFVKE